MGRPKKKDAWCKTRYGRIGRLMADPETTHDQRLFLLQLEEYLSMNVDQALDILEWRGEAHVITSRLHGMVDGIDPIAARHGLKLPFTAEGEGVNTTWTWIEWQMITPMDLFWRRTGKGNAPLLLQLQEGGNPEQIACALYKYPKGTKMVGWTPTDLREAAADAIEALLQTAERAGLGNVIQTSTADGEPYYRWVGPQIPPA